MPSSSKLIFDNHMAECQEAIALYEHIEKSAGFRAEFNLRFVWIAAVSAMDHYISQVILERCTYAYGNKLPLENKLLSDVITFSNALSLRNADPVESVLIFKKIVDGIVRYRSFQYPDKIADGLSYIWSEKHKWNYISAKMHLDTTSVKRKLSGIVDRRNLIAHSGDYDEALGRKLLVKKVDAEEVVSFIGKIVSIVDDAVLS